MPITQSTLQGVSARLVIEFDLMIGSPRCEHTGSGPVNERAQPPPLLRPGIA